MNVIKAISLSVCIFFVFSQAVAENISNYADCDVCHGSIHFDAPESGRIMGRDGALLLYTLPSEKMIKLDLDGAMKNGSRETDDSGYEIAVWSTGDNLFIKDLRDNSLIHIALSVRADVQSVDPVEQFDIEIFLDSGKNEISLKDTLDDAWLKMTLSSIYQWIGRGAEKDEWLIRFKEKIMYLVDLMGKD